MLGLEYTDFLTWLIQMSAIAGTLGSLYISWRHYTRIFSKPLNQGPLFPNKETNTAHDDDAKPFCKAEFTQATNLSLDRRQILVNLHFQPMMVWRRQVHPSD